MPPFPRVFPVRLFPFFPYCTPVRRRGNDNGGGLSSDNAKDIRHLLKMQNIPSEGEKGRERPRLSVMLFGILIAQTSSGSAIRKLPDRRHSGTFAPFVSPLFSFLPFPLLVFFSFFLSFFLQIVVRVRRQIRSIKAEWLSVQDTLSPPRVSSHRRAVRN